jgi:GDP-L-fucose synthase
VNIDVRKEISYLELAKLMKQVINYEGEIILDTTKPDGTPRKLMNVTKLNSLGWKAFITLDEGVKKVYEEVKDRNWEQQIILN